MEKKYNLDKIFIGSVNEITDEYVDSYVYEISDNNILIAENNNYIDLCSLHIVHNDNFQNLRVGSKFVLKKDLVLFKDFLKTNGIGIDKKLLTRDEIFSLHVEAKNNNEETLAIIKPDGMLYVEEIIEMFYQNGLKIKDFKIEQISEEKLEEHYAHLLGKSFYPKLRSYMMSSPVAMIILEGNNAVEKLRNLMGPTDSTKADINTIRGKFGTDITYNAIHGSDSKKSAEKEIDRFFKQKQKVK